MNDLISIILPAYNAEKRLSICINSIINQTYKNLEIIIINDGSTDHTLDIIQNFKENDSRIILINRENKGVSFSRNEGVDISNGEFILFIDSDDYIESTMIETLYNEQKKTGADIVQCGYAVVEENGSIIKEVFQEYVKESKERILSFYLTTQPLYIVPWNKLIRKSIMSNVKFPLNRRYEDEAIMYQIYHYANITVNIPNRFYYYVNTSYGFMRKEHSHIIRAQDLIKAKEDMAIFVSDKYPSIKNEFMKNFLTTLFVWYILCIEESSLFSHDPVIIWIRNKYTHYYKDIKSYKIAKLTTLYVLRYFPLLIQLKLTINKIIKRSIHK